MKDGEVCDWHRPTANVLIRRGIAELADMPEPEPPKQRRIVRGKD